MSAPRLPWNEPALAGSLRAALPGIEVEVLASCDSTNTQLLQAARALPPAAAFAPRLLVAEHQTQGRGRLGRTWVAAPGASLTFSLALAFEPRDWSGLSLAVGLAVAEALEPAAGSGTATTGKRLQLKWPNDLYLLDDGGTTGAAPAGERRSRKLGGILVETVGAGAGAQTRVCVVGIGINIEPLAAAGEVAGLHELRPGLTAPEALAAVALPLVRAVAAFEREGFAPLVARYAALDLLRGRAVQATAHGSAEARTGIADGVDAMGALLMRTAGGVERIVSGEVSVRLAARTATVG